MNSSRAIKKIKSSGAEVIKLSRVEGYKILIECSFDRSILSKNINANASYIYNCAFAMFTTFSSLSSRFPLDNYNEYINITVDIVEQQRLEINSLKNAIIAMLCQKLTI